MTACVPYYRARSRAYRPALARSERGWAQIPLLTKDELRAALPLEVLADGVDIARGLREGWLERLETSGTSGERLKVLADPTLPGAPADDLALWGLAPDERLQRVAVLTSPACFGMACDGSYASRLRGNQLILPSTDEPFHWDAAMARTIVDEITRFDPGELFVNPVYLHALVRACAQAGVALPTRIAFIRCSYQLLSACQRRALADAFPGARVASYYGASELARATVAMECRYGRMHVWEEQCFVEFVDDDGAPVPRGVRGRIVVTPTSGRVTPLVRYVVGDLGLLVDQECACPLGGSPVLVHHGRERDALAVRGRLVSARDIDTVLGDVPNLDAYQLVQRGERDGDFALACIPALTGECPLSTCAARVSAVVGARVDARAVDALDAEPSGKIALTVRLTASTTVAAWRGATDAGVGRA